MNPDRWKEEKKQFIKLRSQMFRRSLQIAVENMEKAILACEGNHSESYAAGASVYNAFVDEWTEFIKGQGRSFTTTMNDEMAEVKRNK